MESARAPDDLQRTIGVLFENESLPVLKVNKKQPGRSLTGLIAPADRWSAKRRTKGTQRYLPFPSLRLQRQFALVRYSAEI